MSVSTICLVSCVSRKHDRSSPARNLYVSIWFIKARGYVEAVGCPWFILSAEHGLVSPDEVIEPYDRTLNKMSLAERGAWARRVQDQMDGRLPDADRIIVLAGQRYRELLMDYLRTRAGRVEVPMEGLSIGKQLSWLARHTPAQPPR